ncbi:hypothetical protein [Streptomyces sp. NBC_01314]|uniref:hypothetical protein n=1 Tax=Streptomyces sp. NBC_01314 TaxID=2903821 RepID=UPI00308CFC99|nr:hypothetical protein OG622_28360 [Streptomyces sp. NBC_01314]
MNLIDLALTTYTEYLGAAEDVAAEQAEQLRDTFLSAARATASARLGSAADQLEWTYTPHGGQPKNTEQATAPLTQRRPEYLRYQYDHDAEDTSFALVQPCSACGHDRISEIPGLTRLGELLHHDHHPADEEDQAPKEEPGPLTAVQVLETRVAVMAGLARRLRAKHPDADVTVSHTVLIAHSHGGATGTLNLAVADVNAVRAVAAALGAEVTTRMTEHGAPYPAVIEYAQANAMVDGIEVELTAYRTLTDDEAAAWRAQQNQATEPDADGGDV